jgi:hypothetical protein
VKVKYICETEKYVLTNGKIYDVLGTESVFPMKDPWYRIMDDTEDDYLYPPESFEIVSE